MLIIVRYSRPISSAQCGVFKYLVPDVDILSGMVSDVRKWQDAQTCCGGTSCIEEEREARCRGGNIDVYGHCAAGEFQSMSGNGRDMLSHWLLCQRTSTLSFPSL